MFARLLPEEGRLIVNGDDPNAAIVSRAARCPVVTVGTNSVCQWQIQDLAVGDMGGTIGRLATPDGGAIRMALPLPGAYNLRNASMALAAAAAVGVDPQVGAQALSSFRGVARRLQCVIESADVALWDDFAHHPTAIRETLEAMRARYPGRRLWALFEPRSNTMVRRRLTAELTAALGAADMVILGPIHRGDKIPSSERLDTRAIVDELIRSGIRAWATQSHDEVFQTVAEGMEHGDVVVAMSNGQFGGMVGRIADQIKETSA
jgi:UDP-N-acetylmuramate: L-alanyl-gamma-D-glutamyl-meso-diaminopimelate ligase